MSTTPLESTARVVTDAAPRYAKQLASHLGRRIEAEPVGDGWILRIGTGVCELRPEPDALVLSASAPDAETLATVEDVVGRHLVRFGARAGLFVEWSTGTRNQAVPEEQRDHPDTGRLPGPAQKVLSRTTRARRAGACLSRVRWGGAPDPAEPFRGGGP